MTANETGTEQQWEEYRKRERSGLIRGLVVVHLIAGVVALAWIFWPEKTEAAFHCWDGEEGGGCVRSETLCDLWRDRLFRDGWSIAECKPAGRAFCHDDAEAKEQCATTIKRCEWLREPGATGCEERR